MKYLAKQDKFEEVRNKYKAMYFIEKLGFDKSYISQVFKSKKSIPKHSAYAITKCIDKEAEILDFFDEVNEKVFI